MMQSVSAWGRGVDICRQNMEGPGGVDVLKLGLAVEKTDG